MNLELFENISITISLVGIIIGSLGLFCAAIDLSFNLNKKFEKIIINILALGTGIVFLGLIGLITSIIIDLFN